MIDWLRSTRGLMALLVVSLAVNVFLASMVIGRITGEATQSTYTKRSIQAMLTPLPDAKREIVRRELNTAMPQMRQQFAALQKVRTALSEEMVKPTPDPGALERNFLAVRTHASAIRAELQQAMIRALPSLSQEERRALVQSLDQRQSGRGITLP
ncbi:MAG: periplasmic heavy metal sensor [Hyphomicrobium sp.]|nr:periplasmic heavy metal sensor [Hyphomicrobium sp.]